MNSCCAQLLYTLIYLGMYNYMRDPPLATQIDPWIPELWQKQIQQNS